MDILVIGAILAVVVVVVIVFAVMMMRKKSPAGDAAKTEATKTPVAAPAQAPAPPTPAPQGLSSALSDEDGDDGIEDEPAPAAAPLPTPVIAPVAAPEPVPTPIAAPPKPEPLPAPVTAPAPPTPAPQGPVQPAPQGPVQPAPQGPSYSAPQGPSISPAPQGPSISPAPQASISKVKDISAPPRDIGQTQPSAPAGYEKFAKKIVLIGDGGVGKTSLINRFVQGMFDDKYIHTIGTNVKKKVVVLPDEKSEVNLMIWDLQGQRNDPYIFSHMYKSEGAVIVCDVTRDNTFNNMPEWITLLEKELKLRVPMIFVGNKADLKDEMVVTGDQIEYLASKYGASHLLTSAKTGDNVESAFTGLAKKLVLKK